MSHLTLALLTLFVPLATAALLAVVAPLRRAGRPAGWLSVGAATAALVASAVLFAGWLLAPDMVERVTGAWLPLALAPDLVELGVHLDGVSVSMLLVVCFVAWCVQVFSLGYMADEPPLGFGRYFTYQSLFLFAMNALVVAPNLLQAFLGWELVGLVSYLLIGFYFRKPSAARAALKAFWVTKFADMGFLVALLVLFAKTGAFEWTAVTSSAGVITALLFVAVVGKSAQFPLHVWLPDAMEGPTPVSALLHAATMVAAGVFLIARTEPLFAQAASTRMVMAYVGGFTALFAACVAVVQTDIKKVLAYSTCSQLGYMVCALGAGSLMGGYFHLTTHAAFKALLFLAAGSVIHAVHSNELSEMGGLARKMPVTAATFIVGSLALAGVPGFSGFFSKDLILEAVHEEGLWAPYVALMAAAFLTAFYMGRVVFLTFFGPPSKAAAEAHEPGRSMLIPLVALAVPALGAGYFAGRFAGLYHVEYDLHLSATGAGASALGLAGIAVSWVMFGKPKGLVGVRAAFAPVGAFIRFGAMDRLYNGGYRVVLNGISAGVAWFDRYVVDGVMNLVAYGLLAGGARLRRVQTGNVQHYVYAVVAALAVMSAWSVLK